MEPVTKKGSVKDLLEELRGDLTEPSRGASFAQHLFTAYWQYSQYKDNKRNQQDGELVIVQDFAENRKAVYAKDIKWTHFGKSQITVHQMGCYYRRGDGIVHHSVGIFSDNIGHDHHAVHCFTLATLDALRKHGSLKRLTLWSDEATSQYKGKGSFADISLLSGMEVKHCFYGSEHSKGEADGETGILSQFLWRAAVEGNSFTDASALCSFMTKHHLINTAFKKREYLVMNEINRERPETDVQTIPGTRSYHQFQRVGP